MIKLKDILNESTAVSRYYDKNPDKLYHGNIPMADKNYLEYYEMLKLLYPEEQLTVPDNYSSYSKAKRAKGGMWSSDSGYYRTALLDKVASRLGVTVSTLQDGLSELNRIQSMSYQKLNPKSYDVLRKLTVGRRPLPKAIYRGMFYDGTKVKDAEVFEKQWAVGKSPNVGLGKPTSWSASKVVASSFAQPQNVTDTKNGYMVILRLDNPTANDIIVDMNALANGMRFFNQMEYIIDPKCRRWVVDGIKRGYDHTKRIGQPTNTAERNASLSQGLSGRSLGEILLDPFVIPYMQMPVDTKIMMMGWSEKSYRQVMSDTKAFMPRGFIYDVSRYDNCSIGLRSFIVGFVNPAIADYLHKFESEGMKKLQFSYMDGIVRQDNWKINVSFGSVTISTNHNGFDSAFTVKMTNLSFVQPKFAIKLSGNVSKKKSAFAKCLANVDWGTVSERTLGLFQKSTTVS